MNSHVSAIENKEKKLSTQDLTMMALLAALLCVSSYISIPLPFTSVSITGQTLAINLIALLMTPKKSGMIVGVWILLGAVGLPVFNGGTGGVMKLVGPTGGYIFGYLAAAVLISLLKGKKPNVIRYAAVTILAGMPVIYLFGAVGYKLATNVAWKLVLPSAVLPFIPMDIVKCVVISIIAKPLQKVVNAGK